MCTSGRDGGVERDGQTCKKKKKPVVPNQKLQPWLEKQAKRGQDKPKPPAKDLFNGKLIRLTEQRKKALRQQALFPLVFFSIMYIN